tara:strand:+ start:28679 stop:28942 length:264 start_codon:yes stop_codon:yes gene_type:complete
MYSFCEKTGKQQNLLLLNPKNQTDADRFFETIENALSPENLHEDGEISLKQAELKERLIVAKLKSLLETGWIAPASLMEFCTDMEYV